MSFFEINDENFRADDFKINGGNSIDCFINDNDPFKFNAGQVLQLSIWKTNSIQFGNPLF